MRRLITTIALSLAALALPASAAAAPAYEPNDGIHQAFGPLAAGTNYDATISSSNDTDWYVLYVSGQGVLDLALTNLPGTSAWTEMTLRDQDGTYLINDDAAPNTTEHIVYTTPGPGTYYVEVEASSAPDQYRLSATGPITAGPRPGPIDEMTPNNNPDLASAFGPLSGGRLYGGSVDISAEEDWFFFYTPGAGAFDIALTNIADTSAWTEMTLRDQDGTYLINEDVAPDTIDHLRYTAAGPTKFALQITSSSGPDQYQFRIDPGSMLTTAEPPSASVACQQATAALEKAKEKLAKAKEARRAAFTPKAKKKAKKKVKKAKRKLKKAREVQKASC